MDKKLIAYCCIVVLLVIGVTVFVSLYFNLQDYRFKGRLAPLSQTKAVASVDRGPQYATEMNLIAGICALFLVGYMFWGFYKKVQKNSQADQIARERSLYNISLATGRLSSIIYLLKSCSTLVPDTDQSSADLQNSS